MRMWLCAIGFAGNCFNECILLPLIEHMPCVHSSRSHECYFCFSLGRLTNFCHHTVSGRGDPSAASCLAQIFYEGHTESPLKTRHRVGGGELGIDCFCCPFQPMVLVGDLSACVCVCVCVCACTLTLQIGLWHSEDGLSMERKLPSINVTDTLFNTTLIITTILVRTVCALTHTHARISILCHFISSAQTDLHVADIL